MKQRAQTDEEKKKAHLLRAMRKPGTVLEHPDGSKWRVDHMGVLRKIGPSAAERELAEKRQLEEEADEKARKDAIGV